MVLVALPTLGATVSGPWTEPCLELDNTLKSVKSALPDRKSSLNLGSTELLGSLCTITVSRVDVIAIKFSNREPALRKSDVGNIWPLLKGTERNMN